MSVGTSKPETEGPGSRHLGNMLVALRSSTVARREFLALGCDGLNRDPFAEFAEQVALAVRRTR
jgi:hypothetical protein